MMRWLRVGGAWLVATVAMVIAASIVHSLSVQAGLTALGVEVPLATRVDTWFGDLKGMHRALLGVFGAALAVGFAVAALARRWLNVAPIVAYSLAGAAAIAVALWIMKLQFAMTPLASARGWLGWAALCLAGALGGFAFARLLPARR